MKVITTQQFKHAFGDIKNLSNSRKFCFILGAGASKSAGIKTGYDLAVEWYTHLKGRLDKNELETWKKEAKIDEQDLASSYGNIYKKRFEHDKTLGYEYLIEEMKNAKPSFGHKVLSQILTKYQSHCVITTNFDSLIETAIYQYSDKSPLVCGHESLSGYARPSAIHPLIVKIHRDLLLDPKSDPDEINRLDKGWVEPLDFIFSTHIPILIGYGGNDGSLMSYLKAMRKPSNFFWCGRDERNLSTEVKNLIEHHDGSFVKIEGFDSLMFELMTELDEIKPFKDDLKKITDERVQVFSKEHDAEEEKSKQKSPAQIERLSAYQYAEKAAAETDFEKRKEIYEEALKHYPNTGWLWWKYTYFLHLIKLDYENLGEFYQKGLQFNREEAGFIGNYAIYLEDIAKNYPEAEKYFKLAIEKDENDADILGNYANYLSDTAKNYPEAEKYYKLAIEKDENDAVNLGNYANYLHSIAKNYPEAEKYYKLAIEKDENHAGVLGNYANYLHTISKNYSEAEKYYKLAIEKDENDTNILGNYTQMLLEHGRKLDAVPFWDKLNLHEEENDLLVELWFYKYAHYPEYREEAERKLESLISKGIRSEDWNFEGNIERAILEGHPYPEKLRDFARRITTPVHQV